MQLLEIIICSRLFEFNRDTHERGYKMESNLTD